MKKATLTLVVLFSFTCTGVWAETVTVFQDGFEGVTPAESIYPTASGDADPDPSKWVTSEPYFSNYMVISTVSTLSNGNSIPGYYVHSGTQSLRVYSNTQGQAVKSVAFDTLAQGSFEFYFYTGFTGARSLNFGLWDGAALATNMTLNAAAAQTVCYYDSTNTANAIATWNTGSWNHLIITADVATQTFTVTLNDTLYDNGGDGYAFYNEGITGLTNISFSHSYSSQQTLIDDVSVSGTLVPEPLTAGLLCLSGVMLLRRRK
ncbi:MAG: PEP-CTERM sorting domain-containing protein [Candidatus Pacebacteria bacterium]|nr:PEP-CTERM sorting domain-containing protein [Candidatus Paceibacterota bacterium]